MGSRLEIDDFQDFNLSPRSNGILSADLVGHVYVEISSGELRQRKIELLLNTLLILLGGLLVTAIMALRLVRSVTARDARKIVAQAMTFSTAREIADFLIPEVSRLVRQDLTPFVREIRDGIGLSGPDRL